VPWVPLLTLGIFHGVNPAMGWLFAVAIGLQQRSRRALLRSLPLIAVGHEASVAVVAVAIELTGSLAARWMVSIGAGLILIGFGVYLLVKRRHFRWVGMRLRSRELVLWSFLMSSAHGAGLMLAPVLLHRGQVVASQPLAEWLHVSGLANSVAAGVAAAGVHSLAMLAAMALMAGSVYEFIGLGILRKAWINLDRIWAMALVAAGVLTLFSRAA
jgi:hypothetical protein